MPLPAGITIYIDYKSPYAFLAKGPAIELAAEFGLPLDWLPYTLQIPAFLGTVEGRNAHQWRRVRYSYMDARRLANERGLIVRGPQKIFDSSLAHIGLLYAKAAGTFAAYNDIVFDRFWKRELDIEDMAAMQAVLAESGADAAAFPAWAVAEGRALYADTIAAAEAMGVFGVPTFAVDGEIFWGGDRIPQVRRHLQRMADAP